MRVSVFVFWLLISFGCKTQNVKPHVNKVDIKKEDFDPISNYYRKDLSAKLEIYTYFKNNTIEGQDVKNMLLKKCFNYTAEVVQQENDSLTEIQRVMSTLGRLVFCADKIDLQGNIYYHISQSASLKVHHRNGIMFRN